MKSDRQWVLTDTDKGVWVESIELTAKELGIKGFPGVAIRKRTLRGGLSEGVDAIEVCNGPFTFTILPTRGMGLWRGDYKGNMVGWQSPARGPVHPKFVNLNERQGLGWLAGFDECIVRCGLESNGAPGTDIIPNNNGVPVEMQLTLHGRIANIPASYVEVSVVPGNPPELRVTGIVYEAMLFCPQFRLKTTISTKAGSNAVTVADEVTNLKSTEAEMQLLYHANFGAPFLGKDSRLVVPADEIAPRDPRAAEDIDTWSTYLGPTPGYVEQCYWFVPRADSEGNSLALLRNAAGDRGVAVRFNVKELPCLTQWKRTGAVSDGYVTGIEPATNYPNVRVFERTRGRTVRMSPGQQHNATLCVEIHDTAEGIRNAERKIAAVQGSTKPVLHKKPQSKFSQI